MYSISVLDAACSALTTSSCPDLKTKKGPGAVPTIPNMLRCLSMSLSSDGKKPVVEPSPGDDQSEDLTGRALRLRIRQQELLAELGVLALQGTSFIEMLNHTARITAEGLSAEYCKVMEFLPAEKDFLSAPVSAGARALSVMPL
jgi:hypothetical protein